MSSFLNNLVIGLAAFGTTYFIAHQLSRIMLMRGLVKTVSSVDNREYYVAPGPLMNQVADALARIRIKLKQVYEDAILSTPEQPLLKDGIANLKKHYISADSIQIHELNPIIHNGVAFNQNKNDGIFICMHKKDDTLADDETLLFIAVHELAHSMQSQSAPLVTNGMTKHDLEFEAYNEYLLSFAINHGYVSSYQMTKRDHCGVLIGEST